MAAALRSSALRRLSSAAAASARTEVRTYYSHTYSQEFSFAAKPDKGDGYFAFAAFLGTIAFVCLLDADYNFWGARDGVVRPPRMRPRRGR